MKSIEAASNAYQAAVGNIQDVVRGRVVMRDMGGVATVLEHLRSLTADASASSQKSPVQPRDSIEIVTIDELFSLKPKVHQRHFPETAGWREVCVRFRFATPGDEGQPASSAGGKKRKSANKKASSNNVATTNDLGHIFELQV